MVTGGVTEFTIQVSVDNNTFRDILKKSGLYVAKRKPWTNEV